MLYFTCTCILYVLVSVVGRCSGTGCMRLGGKNHSILTTKNETTVLDLGYLMVDKQLCACVFVCFNRLDQRMVVK